MHAAIKKTTFEQLLEKYAVFPKRSPVLCHDEKPPTTKAPAVHDDDGDCRYQVLMILMAQVVMMMTVISSNDVARAIPPIMMMMAIPDDDDFAPVISASIEDDAPRQ